MSETIACRKCGRNVAVHLDRCQFCGDPVATMSPSILQEITSQLAPQGPVEGSGESRAAFYLVENGNKLARDARFDEAIACFDRALLHDPKCTWAWISRGIALFHRGDFSQGIHCVDKAVEMEPENRSFKEVRTTLDNLRNEIKKGVVETSRPGAAWGEDTARREAAPSPGQILSLDQGIDRVSHLPESRAGGTPIFRKSKRKEEFPDDLDIDRGEGDEQQGWLSYSAEKPRAAPAPSMEDEPALWLDTLDDLGLVYSFAAPETKPESGQEKEPQEAPALPAAAPVTNETLPHIARFPPRKVKQGAFEESGLLLETNEGDRRISWADVLLTFVGKVDPEAYGERKGNSPDAPLGTASRKGVGAGVFSTGPSYFLLDLYVRNEKRPFRFDPGGTNFRRFLGEKGSLSGASNLSLVIRKLATLIPQTADQSVLQFAENKQSKIKSYRDRDAFSRASFAAFVQKAQE